MFNYTRLEELNETRPLGFISELLIVTVCVIWLLRVCFRNMIQSVGTNIVDDHIADIARTLRGVRGITDHINDGLTDHHVFVENKLKLIAKDTRRAKKLLKIMSEDQTNTYQTCLNISKVLQPVEDDDMRERSSSPSVKNYSDDDSELDRRDCYDSQNESNNIEYYPSQEQEGQDEGEEYQPEEVIDVGTLMKEAEKKVYPKKILKIKFEDFDPDLMTITTPSQDRPDEHGVLYNGQKFNIQLPPISLKNMMGMNKVPSNPTGHTGGFFDNVPSMGFEDNITEERRERKFTRRREKEKQRNDALLRYYYKLDYPSMIKWLRKGADPNIFLPDHKLPLVLGVLIQQASLYGTTDHISHDDLLRLLHAIISSRRFSMCALRKHYEYGPHNLDYSGMTFMTLLLVYHKKSATRLLTNSKKYVLDLNDESVLRPLVPLMDMDTLFKCPPDNVYRQYYEKNLHVTSLSM